MVPLNNDFLDGAKIILLGTVRTGEGKRVIKLLMDKDILAGDGTESE